MTSGAKSRMIRLALRMEPAIWQAVVTLCQMPAGVSFRWKLEILMVSRSKPSRGTNLFSMPSSAPMKRIRLSGMRSFKSFATEMAGLMWPPVPPQVKMTFMDASNQRRS